MTEEKLTPDLEAFLEECLLEFSERYTDADPDYKKIYDLGIPKPPILCPWIPNRFNRDRPGGSRNYNNRRDNYNRHDNHNRDNYNRYDNPNRSRDCGRDQPSSSYSERRLDRRFRPY